MNKEVIYLEPDEEITSIIDKLRELKGAKNIMLVAPKGTNITQSVVNLKILKKEAESLGLEIGLVTQEEIAKNLASQVGLVVFETIDSAKPLIEPTREEPNLNDVIEIDMTEKIPLKPPPGVEVHYYDSQADKNNLPKKEKPRVVTHSSVSPISARRYEEPVFLKPHKPKKWLKGFLVVLLFMVALGALFYFFYPRAIVDLRIKSEPIQEKIEITIDSGINKVSQDNKIPGEIIIEKDEITREFPATGKKNVGEKAKGKVTISNGAGTVADISQGTQLRSADDYIFVTISSISVPKATATVDEAGNVVKNPGTQEVGVEASEAGDKYNIGATTFSVINFGNTSGQSNASFSGGISKEIAIVSEDDLDKAEKVLDGDLKNSLKNKITEGAQGKKLTYLAEAIEFENIQFSADKKASDEAQKFNATLSSNAKTIAFLENNYRENIISALGNNIPQGKELILSSDDEITQGGFSVDYAKGTMKIEGTIKTKVASEIDDNEIKNSIKGKTLSSAQNILRANKDFTNVKIGTKPQWLAMIPNLTSNIKINKSYQNN